MQQPAQPPVVDPAVVGDRLEVVDAGLQQRLDQHRRDPAQPEAADRERRPGRDVGDRLGGRARSPCPCPDPRRDPWRRQRLPVHLTPISRPVDPPVPYRSLDGHPRRRDRSRRRAAASSRRAASRPAPPPRRWPATPDSPGRPSTDCSARCSAEGLVERDPRRRPVAARSRALPARHRRRLPLRRDLLRGARRTPAGRGHRRERLLLGPARRRDGLPAARGRQLPDPLPRAARGHPLPARRRLGRPRDPRLPARRRGGRPTSPATTSPQRTAPRTHRAAPRPDPHHPRAAGTPSTPACSSRAAGAWAPRSSTPRSVRSGR